MKRKRSISYPDPDFEFDEDGNPSELVEATDRHYHAKRDADLPEKERKGRSAARRRHTAFARLPKRLVANHPLAFSCPSQEIDTGELHGIMDGFEIVDDEGHKFLIGHLASARRGLQLPTAQNLVDLIMLTRAAQREGVDRLVFRSKADLAKACGYSTNQSGWSWQRCVESLRIWHSIKVGYRKTRNDVAITETFSPIHYLKGVERRNEIKKIVITFDKKWLRITKKGEFYELDPDALRNFRTSKALNLFTRLVAFDRPDNGYLVGLVGGRHKQFLENLPPLLGLSSNLFPHEIKKQVRAALDEINEVMEIDDNLRRYKVTFCEKRGKGCIAVFWSQIKLRKIPPDPRKPLISKYSRSELLATRLESSDSDDLADENDEYQRQVDASLGLGDA